MKTFCFVFLFALIAGRAHAVEFTTMAIYCNGPVTNGDVSNCPAFGTWMGVRLKNLQAVDLPIVSTDSKITLQDNLGNRWEQALATCQSKFSDPMGCRLQIDSADPQHISIHIEIWDIGNSQRLSLFLNNGNELTVLSQSGDQLSFALTGK